MQTKAEDAPSFMNYMCRRFWGFDPARCLEICRGHSMGVGGQNSRPIAAPSLGVAGVTRRHSKSCRTAGQDEQLPKRSDYNAMRFLSPLATAVTTTATAVPELPLLFRGYRFHHPATTATTATAVTATATVAAPRRRLAPSLVRLCSRSRWRT